MDAEEDFTQRSRAAGHEDFARPPNEKRIVSFAPNDPDNPVNWSSSKKSFIVAVGILTIFNGVFSSSLSSGSINFIAKDFHISGQGNLVLPLAVYQIGFVVGALVNGPLSETYGRRIVMLAPFLLFLISTCACAVAPSWSTFLFFRFVCGASASSPIAITGGIYADIYENPVQRGRANALYLAATSICPQFALLVSGFVSPISWRWAWWIALIMAGLALPPILYVPETYGPIILQTRAQRLRKTQPNTFAPIELEKKTFRQILTVFLARPIRMMFCEAIISCTCLYLSFITGVYYLFFEAYPIIFQGVYGMSTGINGLAFLPVVLGSILGFAGFLLYDSIHRKAQARNAAWASAPENRRLPLACCGGPFCAIALFWLGWTSSRNIHWIVPMLAGIPFGMGFFFIFGALLNYIGDAYRTFSASAMAAISCARSTGSAALPFGATPMYKNLGVRWASTLLALLSLLLSVVPFVFIAYGEKLRRGSRFAQQLAREQEAVDISTGLSVIEPSYPLGLVHKDTETGLVGRKGDNVG